MNYNDTQCSISCLGGKMCGGSGACGCKNQNPFLALPDVTYAGQCQGAGAGYLAWTLTGELLFSLVCCCCCCCCCCC